MEKDIMSRHDCELLSPEEVRSTLVQAEFVSICPGVTWFSDPESRRRTGTFLAASVLGARRDQRGLCGQRERPTQDGPRTANSRRMNPTYGRWVL